MEPLADIIMAQDITSGTVEDLATPYISEEKGVKNAKEAIDGAYALTKQINFENSYLRHDIGARALKAGEAK